MRGARRAATETYQIDRRGSEHRATKHAKDWGQVQILDRTPCNL